MINQFRFLFHLRTDGIADKEFPVIYTKVMLNGTRVNMGSTGLRVTRENWDFRLRRYKGKDATSLANNAQLDGIESQIRSIILYFESRQEKLTPLKLKERFKPSGNFEKPVLKLVNLYLAESGKMAQVGQIAKSSLDTRTHKVKLFLQFLDHEKKMSLLIEELRGPILERYKNWVLLRGCKLAYAQKCQQFVKSFVLWCWYNGHVEENPLANYRVKVNKTPILEHLSEKEIAKLERTVFTKRVQETVDCYLFACYTGLAYVDMTLLSEASIVEEEGREFLKGGRQKTGTSFFVPLFTSARFIIDKYGGLDKLPLRSNKEVNCMLKVAMGQVGVDRRIWFHTARKTFTHRMQNIHRLSDETTAAMIGHKSTLQLKAYRSITQDRVIGEVGNLDF